MSEAGKHAKHWAAEWRRLKETDSALDRRTIEDILQGCADAAVAEAILEVKSAETPARITIMDLDRRLEAMWARADKAERELAELRSRGRQSQSGGASSSASQISNDE